MELNSNLSPKAQIDFDLVVRARESKDERAYAELMTKYRDSIFFMMLKMVKNNDDADDLTIEAFGKAFNRLHQYTPNYAFRRPSLISKVIPPPSSSPNSLSIENVTIFFFLIKSIQLLVAIRNNHVLKA